MTNTDEDLLTKAVPKAYKKDFMELREKVAKREDQLFNNPKYFLLFCITTIVLVLIQYSFTKNAIIPAIVLGILWIVFWTRSTRIGKSYLLIATSIGYIHEVIGVYYGWFSYATGDFGLGVPIWIAIGYGCIYWSIENFWTHAEDKHYFPEKTSTIIWLGTLLSLFVFDFFLFEVSNKLMLNTIFIILLFFLFDRRKEQHFAITVAFFVALEEILGTLLGAWQHPTLSLVKIVPTYIFFAWGILFIVHYLLKGKTIRNKDVILAGAIIALRLGQFVY